MPETSFSNPGFVCLLDLKIILHGVVAVQI
jgi:hypothetical protein